MQENRQGLRTIAAALEIHSPKGWSFEPEGGRFVVKTVCLDPPRLGQGSMLSAHEKLEIETAARTLLLRAETIAAETEAA